MMRVTPSGGIHVIDDTATREDLIEALGHVNREAKREPCWTERKARLHEFANRLLDMLEARDAGL